MEDISWTYGIIGEKTSEDSEADRTADWVSELIRGTDTGKEVSGKLFFLKYKPQSDAVSGADSAEQGETYQFRRSFYGKNTIPPLDDKAVIGEDRFTAWDRSVGGDIKVVLSGKCPVVSLILFQQILPDQAAEIRFIGTEIIGLLTMVFRVDQGGVDADRRQCFYKTIAIDFRYPFAVDQWAKLLSKADRRLLLYGFQYICMGLIGVKGQVDLNLIAESYFSCPGIPRIRPVNVGKRKQFVGSFLNIISAVVQKGGKLLIADPVKKGGLQNFIILKGQG